jgi:hypothetical protein
MSEQLADAVLREKGLTALEEELGPVQALRFLAMISRQPFDYQKWRQHEFDGMKLSEVLSRASAAQP